MRKVVVFPGRFQPMGKHHVQIYKDLCTKFGQSNVYLGTSNSTGSSKNPLTFEQKRSIALKFGIPDEFIFRNDTPYKVENTIKDLHQRGVYLNPDQDMLIFAYGEKDLERFPLFDKNGQPGYFKAYRDDEAAPITSQVFLYAAPLVTIPFRNDLLSGTALRNYLSTASETDFKDTMGFYDADVHKALIVPNTAHSITAPEFEEIEDSTRVMYYEQYLRNLLPADFKLTASRDSLTISMPKLSLTEKIIRRNGKYVVYTADGSTELGSHNTKEDAIKQLKAIHLSQKQKHK